LFSGVYILFLQGISFRFFLKILGYVLVSGGAGECRAVGTTCCLPIGWQQLGWRFHLAVVQVEREAE